MYDQRKLRNPATSAAGPPSPSFPSFPARQVASSKLFDDTWAGVAAEGAVQAKNAA